MITGHKEVEGLQEAERSGPIKMFIGESLEVSDQDKVFSCVADARGLLSSVGLPLAGLLLFYTFRSLKRLRKAWTKKRK